ncbi:unnamed protein product [Spirodela intermedia]|uniref:Uncharacterized protein n=1 Tax=Spirodela intermedia TaxID=51605 RepID=A0A7I8J6T6_SPIIN|nr:unnamed protein product [Spirodela intermedia]CAA6665142.1 unnamed protein product [Spirodela intermedia]
MLHTTASRVIYHLLVGVLILFLLPFLAGKLADIALGYDTSKSLGEYLKNPSSFGALVGRVANRISGAKFSLNGRTYKLFPNDGRNSLHGGHRGFSKVMWDVKEKDLEGPYPFVKFHYHSFDGEQDLRGLPADRGHGGGAGKKPTPVNLVQHVYWNLGGHDSGTVLGHEVQIFAGHITPVDKELIPTGEIAAVAGTAYDFLEPRRVGAASPRPAGTTSTTCWTGGGGGGGWNEAGGAVDEPAGGAVLYEQYAEGSGEGRRRLWPLLGAVPGDPGLPRLRQPPQFPSQIVHPGETYLHRMLFKFSVE